MSHAEHDTVYAKDWACRSFSYATLRTMIEVVLENMPAGECPVILSIPRNNNPRDNL